MSSSLNSYTSAFSSPLGPMHNAHPASSSSILSLCRSPKSSSSSSSSSKKAALQAYSDTKEPLSSPSIPAPNYSGTPPSYYQATGILEGAKSVEEVKEERRARKEKKLREADERMSNELKSLGF